MSAEPTPPATHADAAARLVELTSLDRLILADALCRLPQEPRTKLALDGLLFRLRPPAAWDEQHPAWAPARAALLTLMRGETHTWVTDYWKTARPIHVQETASSFTPPELKVVLELAESAGGQAWFARRLADRRVAGGETLFSLDPTPAAELAARAHEAHVRFDALPAAEKQRVDTFVGGARCPKCARPPAQVLERLLERQSTWIAEVFGLHLGSVDWRVVDTWRAALNETLADRLPVESKKQTLGTLAMTAEATLVFRFHFYANDAANGGTHVMEFPRGDPRYAEVLALAPGLTAGAPRVLYRDVDGVISDRP